MRRILERVANIDSRILPERRVKSRRGTRYSFEAERLIMAHLTYWSRETIARKLGKTVRAIRGWCWRHGQNPRNQDLLTSGQAAAYVGRSQQWLTELARAGRLKARREPGGRWWLFDPQDLDRFHWRCSR